MSIYLSLSLVGDGKFIDNVEVADHDLELIEGDFPIEIGVCLHNSAVNQLLKLCVVQVSADHHLEHLEKFTIRNKSIIVNVVDLESETQFVLLRCACRQRVQTLNKFKERNVSIVVPIKDSDDTFDQGVVGELGDLEELRGFESATLISVDFAKVLVQLLQLLLVEVQVFELLLLLLHLVTHSDFPLSKK